MTLISLPARMLTENTDTMVITDITAAVFIVTVTDTKVKRLTIKSLGGKIFSAKRRINSIWQKKK